jgi:hypothetical protein
VQAVQAVLQLVHELGAAAVKYLPVMHVLHFVAVPSRQVAQSA